LISELATLPDDKQEQLVDLSQEQFDKLLNQSYLATIDAADAAAGTMQILALLEDRLPKSGQPGTGKPQINNLPYTSIRHLFKGRDDKLDMLHKQLAKGEKTAITQAQAIHGLGGIGKTRLAVEFGWHQIENAHVSGVFFVLADSLTNLISNLANLAIEKYLDIPGQAQADQTKVVEKVIETLSQMKDCLVIFDNVDDEHAIEKLHEILPQLASCKVLITSRQSNWKNVKKLPIDKLAEKDAVAYLLEKTEDRSETQDDEELANSLARKLDGLPIALEQVAAYINHRRIGFQTYLDKFEDARKEVLKWHDNKLQDYPKPVLIAWQTTEDQLTLMEKTVLRLASFMAPESIPAILFEEKPEIIRTAIELYAKENGEDLQQDTTKPTDIRDVLAELSGWSMIKLTEKSFYVHRLVQDSVRLRIPDETIESWTEVALVMVRGFIPDDTSAGDIRSWDVWNIISPHVLAITEYGNNAKIPEPTGWLMNSLALYYYTKASFEVVELLFRKALAINENTVGPNHQNTASCLNNLAGLLQATNRLDEAEPLMRRALSIDESSFGANHPNVARDLNNLAVLLQDTNRLDEAEPLMKRALSIDESSFGADHPNVAIRLNNLAQLLQATNRLDEAEPLMRRALAIDESSFGADHPNVAIRLNNLALLLQATNRLDQAEPLMRRAMAIDEASFGTDHPDVARGLNNLAVLLKATNRLDEAEPLMRRTLAIDEASFGAEHPKVAIRLNNLAMLLQATNRLDEAEPLMRRALAIDEASFGGDHPDVARDLNNLAGLLQSTNRLDEAEPLMKRALSIDESSVGPNHPNVARSLNNLAALLKATNRLDEAEPLMERVINIFEEAYGPNHPNVATALNNLALLFQDTNRLNQAEPLIKRALTIDESSFGADHPNVAIRLNNLAALLQATNRLDEAEPLMKRVVEIFLKFTRQTGHKHPHLEDAIGNYRDLLTSMGYSEDEIKTRLKEME